jgi:hypothetical protein
MFARGVLQQHAERGKLVGKWRSPCPYIHRSRYTVTLFYHRHLVRPLSLSICLRPQSDPAAFAGVLSYLRCDQVILSDVNDDAYLQRLAIEADFYSLGGLVDAVSSEMERRRMLDTDTDTDVKDTFNFKAVGASEANRFFELGWSFVDTYQGNDSTACSTSGSKVEALWQSNHCTACGEGMSFEKFSKHVTFFNPTMVAMDCTPYICTSALAPARQKQQFQLTLTTLCTPIYKTLARAEEAGKEAGREYS